MQKAAGNGGTFQYGASHFWDVSRQMKITISNPNLIPKADFAQGLGVLYDTQPQITSVPVPFPLDPVMGNDDAHHSNSIAGDESNDPYTSSSNGDLSHNITQIVSIDAPSSFVTVAAGATYREYGELNEFREFVRVNLPSGWYRISDYEDWRFDFRVKFIGGKWQNNGCDPIPTP